MRDGSGARVVGRIRAHVLHAEEVTLVVGAIESEAKRREGEDEDGNEAVFDRNVNGWVRVPSDWELPDNQQDRDMIAREFLLKFQMSDRHPLSNLRKAYMKF